MTDDEHTETDHQVDNSNSPGSGVAGVMPHDADEDTLRAVYYLLRDDYPEAACIVADQLLGQSVEEWAASNASRFTDKIKFVKEIRAQFGLPLKQAKEVADEAMARAA